MKILQINKFYRPVGGPETVMFDTIRELESLGHTVIPFAMAHQENTESEYSRYFVSNIDYNAAKAKKGLGKLVKEALDIVSSSEARQSIESLIRDIQPDIAHAHNIYHQLSPSILVALKKAGIPTVLTLHDGKLSCANMLFLTHGKVCEKCRGRWFHNAVLNKCVKDSYASSLVCCLEGMVHRLLGSYERNVDLFITPSRFLKSRLVEHKRLPEHKIEVLPNYADTNSISPDFTPGGYGFFAGRLEPLKGVRTLLQACREIPEFEVRLAGRGPLLDEGESFVDQENLSKVKFLGFQTGENLSRLFSESLFVALPSECYENCPMTILEAFAYGKPVIASKIGGIPELIEDGVDGLLFEPGDAEGLASCICKLIESPDLAREMGMKARAKVEERYSISAYMDSLMALYKRLC